MGYPYVPIQKLINIIGLHSFTYFEHDSHFFFRGERHNFWEILYVDRGEVSVSAENDGFLLKQGEIIFHKPNEFHSVASTEDDAHNIIVISFETDSSSIHFFENKKFILNVKQRKIFSSCLQEMKNAYQNNFTVNRHFIQKEIVDVGSFQLAISLLESLLIDLLRDHSVSEHQNTERNVAKKNIESALIDSLKEYLKENIYNNLSLQDICKHYGLSKSYLYQAFHQETNKSLIDYYIDLKINEAKYLIRQEGTGNLTQISEKLGYSSIHHFSRSFKNKTGMLPSTYAKTIK